MIGGVTIVLLSLVLVLLLPNYAVSEKDGEKCKC